ncbi:iron-sulfur cluster assembly scaffold protein [Jannaschia seohaensis]|uniref:NifU homolog involved in Fe-S cluster formation n=1 Tax=Jannaschia seohaensis TaxID=475081 RepID=A0A2Y9AK21_9RHOB|nr:iron-sulfur cluster assembly scaffold protein [Jannaschia seohaensis]PWJ20417.1 NifU-like protein involved in Fe-S cluster formation [Jannaschia seohaensis]SSA44495.1 NifU homolog involved in Fe-S cluster formation [Jannaschia seohaensis]
MADADLIKLYSGRILELAADMPATEPLEAPQATVRKRSPLCGSTVTVSLNMAEGRITDYAQDVKACALGQASASVSGRVMIGRSLDEVRTARDQLRAMLRDGGPVPDAPFDGLEVLTPARDYRNRHASILLALDATVAAMEQLSEASLTAP